MTNINDLLNLGSGQKVRLMDIIDTHNIYEIYYEHRLAVKPRKGSREVYGDKQVHVEGVNVNKLPKQVLVQAKPFGKEKGTVARWYYLPNTSLGMILAVFINSGYSVVEQRIGTTVFGERTYVYVIAKKK